MTSYSHYDFITVEDYNSVLARYGANYNDVYVLDYIKVVHALNQGDTTYDFLRIFQDSNYVRIAVENPLWKGELKILECTMSEGWGTRPSITPYGDAGFRISNWGIESLKLGLVLSNKTSFRFDVNEMRVEGVRDLTVPYPVKPTVTYRVLDGDGSPMVHTEVLIFRMDNWLLVDHKYTDSEGYCTLELLSMDEPCTFNYEVLATTGNLYNSYDYFKVNYTRIAHAPVVLTNTLYADSVNNVLLEFLFDNASEIDYRALFEENNIQVYANNHLTVSELNGDEDVYYNSIVDLTGYNKDTVDIKITSTGNKYISPFSVEYTLPVSEYTVERFSDIVGICEAGSHITAYITEPVEFTDTINIPEGAECTLVDISNSTHTVDGGVDCLFDVTGTLNLQGFNVEDADACIICQEPGSTVNMEECVFTNITPDNNEHNSILYCRADADSINDKTLFRTNINSCSFINCPSALFHSGICEVNDSVFDMSYDSRWFDGGEYLFSEYPFGIYQQYGQLTLHRNTITFDFSDEVVSDLIYGHLFVWLGTKVTVNSKPASSLQVKNTFPLNTNKSSIRLRYNHNSTVIVIVPEREYPTQAILWTVEDTNKLFDNHTIISEGGT